ncbi:hypothetical protein PR202_ga04628 [Eleusine coracana subsp. coracana]|uniref:Uncharacterized protein n=1 Tax=Eleusine coracana subsp. coracana TaxID=191504 RepID=A0AAV5BSH1_ELECO|nr:hypothetical protein PR202_ga04628 [Eleusine coracana subsp. coracana]
MVLGLAGAGGGDRGWAAAAAAVGSGGRGCRSAAAGASERELLVSVRQGKAEAEAGRRERGGGRMRRGKGGKEWAAAELAADHIVLPQDGVFQRRLRRVNRALGRGVRRRLHRPPGRRREGPGRFLCPRHSRLVLTIYYIVIMHALLQMTVLWSGFDKLELHPSSFKNVLLVGYSNGFQVLDVEDAANVCELVSKRDGPVTFLQMQPIPVSSEGTEGFRASHPMLLVVAGDETNGMVAVQGRRLSALMRDTNNEPQTGVRCSPRVVAVALATQIYCFDAVTLENKLSVLTYPLQGAPGVNIGYGPMAVGPRWLAYATNTPLSSNTGRLSPQNLTPSPGVSPSTSPSSGSLVARYAMESSKQLAAAGIIDMGCKTLSRYCQELMPDGSNSPLSSSPGRRSVVHPLEADNAGMVVIKDFTSKVIISQFRAHTSPISALCFDPSGTLLVTASVHGHNINVFRIMPACIANGFGSKTIRLGSISCSPLQTVSWHDSSCSESSDSSPRVSSGSNSQLQDDELHVTAEPIQWWDVCRRTNWPERDENIAKIVVYNQRNNMMVMDTSDTEDSEQSDSTPSNDGMSVKEIIRGREKSSWYLSNAEVQINSWRIPIWQKSKICFYVMDHPAEESGETVGVTGGEIEIEKLPLHEVEIRRRELLPVFKQFHYSERNSSGRNHASGGFQSDLSSINDAQYSSGKGTGEYECKAVPPISGFYTDMRKTGEMNVVVGQSLSGPISAVNLQQVGANRSPKAEDLTSCYKVENESNGYVSTPRETNASTITPQARGSLDCVPSHTRPLSSYSLLDGSLDDGVSPANGVPCKPETNDSLPSNGASTDIQNGCLTGIESGDQGPSDSHNSVEFTQYFQEGYCKISELDDCRELTEAVTDADSSSSHCEREKPEEDGDNDDMLGGVFAFSEEGSSHDS